VQAAHDIGLFVRVCISDMGPSNRNMWKTVGVFSRRNSTSNYIQHPCTSTATDRLYFMADTPHLLKNLRNCLLTQMIVLPPSTVVKAGLPHNQVSMEHVRQLVDLQDDMQLKAPSEFADLLEEKTYGGLTYPSTLVWCAVHGIFGCEFTCLANGSPESLRLTLSNTEVAVHSVEQKLNKVLYTESHVILCIWILSSI